LEGEPTKCPYRAICQQCPGNELGRGEWKPLLGFKRVSEGILCLDWNKVIPLEESPLFREPEGRHLADAVVAADRLDAATRRYNKSPKRKKAQKKYGETDKGKVTAEKYQDTEKFHLALQKYYLSKKGQQAYQKRGTIVKDFRKATKWLKGHPGMTYEDYLKENPE